jgi:hypothetical protein
MKGLLQGQREKEGCMLYGQPCSRCSGPAGMQSRAAALARRVLTVLTGNWSGCWQAGRHLLVPRQCFVDKPWRACCRACAAG